MEWGDTGIRYWQLTRPPGIDFFSCYVRDKVPYYILNEYDEDHNYWVHSASVIPHPYVSCLNEYTSYRVFHNKDTISLWITNQPVVDDITKDAFNKLGGHIEHSSIDDKLWYPGEGKTLEGVRRMDMEHYNKWIDYLTRGISYDGK